MAKKKPKFGAEELKQAAAAILDAPSDYRKELSGINIEDELSISLEDFIQGDDTFIMNAGGIFGLRNAFECEVTEQHEPNSLGVYIRSIEELQEIEKYPPTKWEGFIYALHEFAERDLTYFIDTAYKDWAKDGTVLELTVEEKYEEVMTRSHDVLKKLMELRDKGTRIKKEDLSFIAAVLKAAQMCHEELKNLYIRDMTEASSLEHQIILREVDDLMFSLVENNLTNTANALRSKRGEYTISTVDKLMAKRPEYLAPETWKTLIADGTAIPQAPHNRDLPLNEDQETERQEFRKHLYKLVRDNKKITAADYKQNIAFAARMSNMKVTDYDIAAEAIETIQNIGKVLGYDLKDKGLGR